MTGGHLQKRKDEMIEKKRKRLSSDKLKLETIFKNKEIVSLKIKRK